MTQQFHEGQDVEVWVTPTDTSIRCAGGWRKAKIVTPLFSGPNKRVVEYQVQFQDGSRAVFDAAHIRAAISRPSGGGGDRFASDFECANGDCE